MSNLSYRFSRTLFAVTSVAFATLIAGGSADAATATDNLSVTASVAANCSISTAAVAFGAYDPIVTNASAALDGTGTVSVTCTDGASTTITLAQGANADVGSTDDAPVRRMNDGGTNYLAYLLYSDAGRTTVWGNTAPTGLAHTGSGLVTNLTVYGRTTGGQNVPAGSYSDTVIATITF